MTQLPRVLIVDDELGVRESLRAILAAGAEKARAVARPTLDRVYGAIGIN